MTDPTDIARRERISIACSMDDTFLYPRCQKSLPLSARVPSDRWEHSQRGCCRRQIFPGGRLQALQIHIAIVPINVKAYRENMMVTSGLPREQLQSL